VGKVIVFLLLTQVWARPILLESLTNEQKIMNIAN